MKPELYNRVGYPLGEWTLLAIHVTEPGTYLLFEKYSLEVKAMGVELCEGQVTEDCYLFESQLGDDLLGSPGSDFRSRWVLSG